MGGREDEDPARAPCHGNYGTAVGRGGLQQRGVGKICRVKPAAVKRTCSEYATVARRSVAPTGGTCLATPATSSQRALGRTPNGGMHMVTIVTEIRVKKGSEPQWDELMRERMATARKHSGWIGGQLLRPE